MDSDKIFLNLILFKPLEDPGFYAAELNILHLSTIHIDITLSARAAKSKHLEESICASQISLDKKNTKLI